MDRRQRQHHIVCTCHSNTFGVRLLPIVLGHAELHWRGPSTALIQMPQRHTIGIRAETYAISHGLAIARGALPGRDFEV